MAVGESKLDLSKAHNQPIKFKKTFILLKRLTKIKTTD